MGGTKRDVPVRSLAGFSAHIGKALTFSHCVQVPSSLGNGRLEEEETKSYERRKDHVSAVLDCRFSGTRSLVRKTELDGTYDFQQKNCFQNLLPTKGRMCMLEEHSFVYLHSICRIALSSTNLYAKSTGFDSGILKIEAL